MGRTPCCDKNGLKKGPWTSEEDQKLMDYIHNHGYGNWRTLPKNAGLQRCGKSCRLRWTNYLRPDIKRGRFSFEEEEIIIQLHSILGNKWSAIAARLPGRTDNEIKNYWNTHIRKRLLRMGIDPVTHNPRLDLLDLSSFLTNSLYNNSNSHLNLSTMLASQSLVNPQLLRLASSLLSSHQSTSPALATAFQQNQAPPDPQFPDHQIDQNQNQLQLQHRKQIDDIASIDTLNYQISEQQQHNQIDDMAPIDSFNYQIPNHQQQQQQNLSDVAPYSSTDNYIPTPTLSNCNYNYNYNYYNPDQPVMDNSIFYSTDNNFGAYATPSATSSPTTLNSNSNSTTTTYVNGSGTEDEREIISYSCTDMFDMIPDFLGVSDFACNDF